MMICPKTFFELELKGYNIISIGLIDTYEYDYYEGQIGWHRGSIGLHSDNGSFYFEDGFETDLEELQPVDAFFREDCIIGCGYDSKTKSVFWTKNGSLLLKKPFVLEEFESISAAFALILSNAICALASFIRAVVVSSIFCLYLPSITAAIL